MEATEALERASAFDVDVRSEIDAAARAGVRYFASGSNHPGEIVGLARCGIDVGVAIHELHSAGELAIAEAVGLGARVFVDSGAFSEIGFGPTGPFVAKPITDADWIKRLEAYVRLARACGERLFVVAPDQVAFQAETLERMARFGSYVREAASYGANVLVPVQKGATPMAAFWRAAIATLGVPTAQLVAAIPMKKDATSTAELVAFLRDAQPARVHLLGLGPKSPRFAEVVAAARRAAPAAELLCDSVLITSLVGRTNGRGGAPRPLTAALDAVSAELEEGLFLGDCGDVDWTEAASCPSVWLTAAGLRRFADAVGATGADRDALLADVDAWLQDDDRYLWPHVEGALATLWAEYARGPGSTTWRKRESITRLFGAAR
jgi:hypothetical protein